MAKSLRSARALAAVIEHSLLKPDAVVADVRWLCEETVRYEFGGVCVQPCYVRMCREFLDRPGTPIRLVSVAGFPLGATTAACKAREAAVAVADGADEIDMVLNIGYLKDGRSEAVRNEIAGVVAAIGGRVVKTILETGLLTEGEIARGCEIARQAGARFVKTSTGFGPRGASVEDVRLMRRVVGPDFGVKAAGGIRDAATAWAMLEAGADRLGTSASPKIMEEACAYLPR